MSQGSQQAITHVLQQDSKVLGTLLNKLNQLAQMNQLLAQNLEPKLVPHCQVANLENNCLTVITNNAIWATQFRFQIPSLLDKLRMAPELTQLKSIVCKITPVIGQREVPEPTEFRLMPKLSLQTAGIILATAKSIQNPKLQSIMQRIAKNIG